MLVGAFFMFDRSKRSRHKGRNCEGKGCVVFGKLLSRGEKSGIVSNQDRIEVDLVSISAELVRT